MQAILIRATKVIGAEKTDFYPCDRTVRAARASHCGLRIHPGKRGSGHGGDATGAVEQPGC